MLFSRAWNSPCVVGRESSFVGSGRSRSEATKGTRGGTPKLGTLSRLLQSACHSSRWARTWRRRLQCHIEQNREQLAAKSASRSVIVATIALVLRKHGG